MKKQLAVFTIDYANYHDAANHAADLGWRAEMYFPKDVDPNGDTHAELYDLDNWVFTAHERETLITTLCREPLRHATGLHSYNVSGDEAAELRKNGVIFARRLSRELILALLHGGSSSAAGAA